MNRPQINLDARNMAELGLEQSIFTQWDQDEFTTQMAEVAENGPQLQKKTYLELALPAAAIHRRIYFYMEFSFGYWATKLHRLEAVLRFSRNNRLLSEIPVSYLLDTNMVSYNRSAVCVSGPSAVAGPGTVNVALSKKFRKAAGSRVVTLNPYELTTNADRVSFDLKGSAEIWYISAFVGVMSSNRR